MAVKLLSPNHRHTPSADEVVVDVTSRWYTPSTESAIKVVSATTIVPTTNHHHHHHHHNIVREPPITYSGPELNAKIKI
jgi:hypothetical protein